MAHTDKILEWIRKGDMTTAVYDVRYTLDRFANHTKGLQMAGIVATLTKKPSLAVYYFERALKLYPQYAITHAQYGAYLLNIGKIDVALARLKEAVDLDPKFAGAYALMAKAYTKNGNSELALQAAEKARELGYKGEVPGG
jgi:Tfp pilus assembly protein PilF